VWAGAVRACGNEVPPSGSRAGGQARAREARGGKDAYVRVGVHGCAWHGAHGCAGARGRGDELPYARAFCQTSHTFHTRHAPQLCHRSPEEMATLQQAYHIVGWRLAVGGFACIGARTHPHRTWGACGAWHARPRPRPRPVCRDATAASATTVMLYRRTADVRQDAGARPAGRPLWPRPEVLLRPHLCAAGLGCPACGGLVFRVFRVSAAGLGCPTCGRLVPERGGASLVSPSWGRL
jgi:hypothetical protein